MGLLASADDLEDFLNESFDSGLWVQAESALAIATGAIKSHTTQQLERVTDDVAKLRGNWSRELVLPQWPVVAVSAIKLNGLPIQTGSWLLASNTLYRGNLPIFNGPDDWGGELWVTSWLGPISTIEVTYTHGFDVIPDDIRGICLRAAARLMANPEDLRSERMGNYTYNAREGAEVLTPAEMSALDRYNPTV